MMLFKPSFSQGDVSFILKAEFAYNQEQYNDAWLFIDSVKEANFYSDNIKGKILLKQNKIDKALTQFHKSNKDKEHYSDFDIVMAYAQKKNYDSLTIYLKRHLSSNYKEMSNVIESNASLNDYRASEYWSKLNLKDFYTKEDEAIERAIFYKNKKEISLALDILDDLLINNKSFAEAYYYRAKFIILLNNDYKYAIDDLKKAIKIDKTNPDYLFLIAEFYLHERKYKKALDFYKKANISDPYYLDNYERLAEANYRMNEYEEAIRNINLFLNVNYRNVDALKLAGQIYYDKGDYKKSIAYLTQATYINCRRIDVLVARGKSYLENDEYQRAGMDFNIALDLDSKNGELWYLKGLAFMYQDKMKQACKYFTKASYLNYYKAEEYLLKECQ